MTTFRIAALNLDLNATTRGASIGLRYTGSRGVRPWNVAVGLCWRPLNPAAHGGRLMAVVMVQQPFDAVIFAFPRVVSMSSVTRFRD